MDYILYIKLIVVVIFGLFLGFLSAIPVGAVQLEVAKKALNGHLKPAIAIAMGSATSDMIYGLLTLFGLGHFLSNKKFQIIVYVLGIIVLAFIFSRSFKEYTQKITKHETHLVFKKKISFLTGFTIAITNPGMVIWWIVGYRLFIDLSLFPEVNTPIKMLFVLSGCSGLSGYLVFIAHALDRMKKSVSDNFLHRMNLVLMILLTVLIVYFIAKLTSVAFNYNLKLP